MKEYRWEIVCLDDGEVEIEFTSSSLVADEIASTYMKADETYGCQLYEARLVEL